MHPASIHTFTSRSLYLPILIAAVIVTIGGLLFAGTHYARGHLEIRTGVVFFAVVFCLDVAIAGMTPFRVGRLREFYENQPNIRRENIRLETRRKE